VGVTISIPAKSSRNLNVLGFLNVNKQKLFASCTYDKVDTDVVIEHFNLFASELKKETIAVIDNASIHTSKKFKAMLEIWESQGLKIFYLPTYSPQLNPIEQLWKFMKYYWIEFDAYKSSKHMQDYVEKIIVGYGKDYEINFG
jgi:transposase